MVKSSSRANSSATFMPLPAILTDPAASASGSASSRRMMRLSVGAVERDRGVGRLGVAVGQVGQRAVLQGQRIALGGVGELPVDDDGLALRLLRR